MMPNMNSIGCIVANYQVINGPDSDVALLMVDVIHIQYTYVQYAIHVHRMCCVMTVNSVNLQYMVSLAGGATPCMERKG